jgi:hypothetical protein
MTTALRTCYYINADWHTFFLEAIAFPLLWGGFSFKGLLSQWAGVIMCLPSQLCQISISISNKDTWHNTQVFDLTYFWRSSSKRHSCWHISLLFDLEHSSLVWTCISAPSTFLPNFGPIGLQIWPPGAMLENQQSAITPELMAGSAPIFYH